MEKFIDYCFEKCKCVSEQKDVGLSVNMDPSGTSAMTPALRYASEIVWTQIVNKEPSSAKRSFK